MPPETRYAQSGDTSIAYQTLGEGPFDLVIVPGFVSHVEQAWEDSSYARFLQNLASFCRLIMFDKRGTGLSDRVTGTPTLEERMDDVRAVMEAAGSKRAALFGISEGGPMSVLFAATYPERTNALVLYGSIARLAWASDYPWGVEPGEAWEAWLASCRKEWGGPWNIDVWAPSAAEDERFRRWWAKYLRLSASPSAVINIFRMNMAIDVRDILPTIRCPTLVLHRSGDRPLPVMHGRYLAEHIAGARLVELEGEDHLWWVGDSLAIVSEIQQFLTGNRPNLEPDRVLATVLFTDIVESTKRAIVLGDRHWRELLDGHNAIVRREVDRFRGRAIKSTGDGFLATFDGPARAIRCALSISNELKQLGITIRAGLHTGEIEVIGEDVGGIAVHIAARVLGKAERGQVWISRTVRDLVAGSDFTYANRGLFDLEGVPEQWNLFALSTDESPSA